MNLKILLPRVVLILSLWAVGGGAKSQVFIPTTMERDWLNEQIPGIVDGSGIMDTLHPGIAQLTEAQINIQSFQVSDIDLRGLGYLDSLTDFSIDVPYPDVPLLSATIDRVPFGLRDLRVELFCTANITLPALPNTMNTLALFVGYSAPGTRTLQIEHMPDSLDAIRLSGFDEISWGGVPYAGSFSIDPPLPFASSHLNTLSLPPMVVDQLGVLDADFDGDLDLSNVTARDVYLDLSCEGSIFWPMDMEDLLLTGYTIQDLDPFPNTLQSLWFDVPELCLPWLPDGLTSLVCNVPCLPNWPSQLVNCNCLWESPETANYCSVLNSDCPGSNPGIAGRIHVDLDGNGQFDTGEPPLPQASIVLQPYGNTTGCDGQGYWEIGVSPGNYTIVPSSYYPYIQSYSPTEHIADLPEMGLADVDNDFAVTLTPNITDLRTWLWADPARPGFDNRLYLTCQNYGTIPLDAELTLTFDGDQTWVGSSIAPASSTSTSTTWTFPNMAIGASTTLTVDLTTATDVALGTPIEHLVVASAPQTDETPGDNIYTFSDSVVGSYDPNDKLLRPAVLSPAQVQAGETPIEYTVRFQNTGTYLAERVVILDTLSEDLQWESMRFLDSSHPNHWYVRDGVLHVIHNDINLPDSTSDEANSHGFVRFSLLPSTELVDGETISNIAHIIFDFNQPIITPPAVFSVDVLATVPEENAPPFSIYPNPVHDQLHVSVSDGSTNVPFSIHDPIGRVVVKGTLFDESTIDTSELPTGVFVLRLEMIEGVGNEQFIKH